MNSGFTKVYALLNSDFIIYDGRVGAALGYMVARSFSVGPIPELLQFAWSNGMAKKNRNPSGSDPGRVFPHLTPRNHALWNIRANWIVQEVVQKLKISQRMPSWIAESPARRIEAALFMLGQDIPPQVGAITRYVDAKDANVITAYGGTFDVNDLIKHMRERGMRFIVQGQQKGNFASQTKPNSLDYWIREKTSDKDRKQADNSVIHQLVQTGFFLENENLLCPDSGRRCKGIELVDDE